MPSAVIPAGSSLTRSPDRMTRPSGVPRLTGHVLEECRRGEKRLLLLNGRPAVAMPLTKPALGRSGSRRENRRHRPQRRRGFARPGSAPKHTRAPSSLRANGHRHLGAAASVPAAAPSVPIRVHSLPACSHRRRSIRNRSMKQPAGDYSTDSACNCLRMRQGTAAGVAAGRRASPSLAAARAFSACPAAR